MNRQREYLLTRVRTASPIELVSLLYETAIQATEEALAQLRSGDVAKRGEAVNRAVEAIFELKRSLRFEASPEYCRNLSGLYTYLLKGLSQAHTLKSEENFEEVARLLRTLLEGWTGAIQNLTGQSAQAPTPEAVAEVHAAALNSRYFEPGPTGSSESRSWQL